MKNNGHVIAELTQIAKDASSLREREARMIAELQEGLRPLKYAIVPIESDVAMTEGDVLKEVERSVSSNGHPGKRRTAKRASRGPFEKALPPRRIACPAKGCERKFRFTMHLARHTSAMHSKKKTAAAA